jgi:hypothetical protein
VRWRWRGVTPRYRAATALDEVKNPEYARALELDPEALSTPSKTGVAAQIASPEERAKYSYILAKIHAKRGDAEQCFRCLRVAKDEGYRDLGNVYKDEEFSSLWKDPRLAEIVPPPAPK